MQTSPQKALEHLVPTGGQVSRVCLQLIRRQAPHMMNKHQSAADKRWLKAFPRASPANKAASSTHMVFFAASGCIHDVTSPSYRGLCKVMRCFKGWQLLVYNVKMPVLCPSCACCDRHSLSRLEAAKVKGWV